MSLLRIFELHLKIKLLLFSRIVLAICVKKKDNTYYFISYIKLNFLLRVDSYFKIVLRY